MKTSFIQALVLLAAFAIQSAFAGSDILPFPVKVDGKPAVLAKDTDIVAKIAEPVPATAELELGTPADVAMIIINAFPSDAAGTPKEGATPAILMGQNTKKVKLDATMDKKKLGPGFYVLNIVAAEKTARILLQIK